MHRRVFRALKASSLTGSLDQRQQHLLDCTLKMRLLKTSLAATSLLFASVQAAVLKRSTIVPLVPFSTVPEPADGSAVAAGQSFPLDYPVSIYPPCPSSLYPLQFFLLDHLPTASDVNPDFSTTGGPLLNPLYQFGDAWLGWTEPGKHGSVFT